MSALGRYNCLFYVYRRSYIVEAIVRVAGCLLLFCLELFDLLFTCYRHDCVMNKLNACPALHQAEQSVSATSSSCRCDGRRPGRAVSARRAVSVVCSVVSSPGVCARSSSAVGRERSVHVSSGVIRARPAVTRQASS